MICLCKRSVRRGAGWLLAAAGLLAVATGLLRAAVPVEEMPVNAFAFVGPDVGLAVGDAGLILETTDGGKTWKRSPSGVAEHLQAVHMVDQRIAYAAGGIGLGPGRDSHGILLKTVSGGAAWRTVGTRASRYRGVSARGDNVAAWCDPCTEVPSGLLVSRNAGQTWRTVAGNLSAPIVAIHWSAGGGTVLSADGVAWRWHTDSLERLAGQRVPGRLTAAHFITAESWVVACQDGRLMITRDAGRTWRTGDAQGMPSARGIEGLSFHSPTEGCFVGVGPTGIQYTADGGATWKPAGAAPVGPLRAVRFRDAWNGLVAGPFGTIHRTTDGGATWTCVRGAQRRAALLVVEPYGSVADWPLVSMLAGDRGHRTVLWWATAPADEPLLVCRRRLRDAAWALGGVEAMVLADRTSARVDGAPGFTVSGAMPHADGDLGDPRETSATVAEIARLWRPAVILSPSEVSEDREEAFVARAVGAAAKAAGVRRWIADPDNHTGKRVPGAASRYPVSVSPLTASEEYGAYHGVRAQVAARLVRTWPAPVAESLGYNRPGTGDADPYPSALLKDLADAEAATRRPVKATARVPLSRRLAWEREAGRFHPQFKVHLARSDFGTAYRCALDFCRSQPGLQLGQSALAEVLARAATAGSTDTAEGAAGSLIGFAAFGQTWVPWSEEAIVWLIDRHSSLEWRVGPATELALAPAVDMPKLERLRAALALLAPRGLKRPDVRYQWYRLGCAGGQPDAAQFRRLVERDAASADPLLARLVALEQWLRTGRQGEPPMPVIPLAAAGDPAGQPDRHEEPARSGDTRDIVFGPNLTISLKERGDVLILSTDTARAGPWWLTVDMDRDGRTLLAEPLADGRPPAAARVATAAAPVWVRRTALWRREIKDDKLALALRWTAVGGRPKAGTVWVLTLRRRTVAGIRPTVDPTLNHLGCLALEFK